jgi:hypothetical protein
MKDEHFPLEPQLNNTLLFLLMKNHCFALFVHQIINERKNRLKLM